MKTTKRILVLVVLTICLSTTVSRAAGEHIKITAIQEVGVSAEKETHSIVQVSWIAQESPDLKHTSFELSLEVSYADGFVERTHSKAAGDARTARFEVPTLHRSTNHPAAEMKNLKVSITANYSATTMKQVAH
jgi:hypothetical protein